ncbi:MAG: methionine--tRNA ligase [Candidatus Marinimicrobia bacterium]|nr:methionine--tRNA ligase [Candidatus Neomarinimicrobiota bacterium]
MSKFYITTPIYYVNDEPHIGHAYTTILADVLSRYHREAGDDVFFLTGTDEHGQKVYQAAQERGIDPKRHCDETVVRFKELWEKLHIRYDYFIRTTDEYHKEVVKAILNDIYEKGDIYFDEYSGHYCVGCERFYTEKELLDGKCPQHKKILNVITEKNYFFKMSRYQQQLIDYIHENPKFIQPDFRRNEVLGFLRQPLEDLCISRPKTRLTWGIELPFDADYVTYVWFDALINYVSAIGVTKDKKQFDKWWPAEFHLIGKDILTTHCVYWPTMLFASGIPLPRTIFAHGWWLSGDFKMSKSLGNIVKPLDLIDQYGVDPIRYFLMRDMVLGQDSNFSIEAFVRRYNSDLANDLGNLVGRICTLITRHFDGKIPQVGDVSEGDDDLRSHGERIGGVVKNLIENMRVNKVVEETLQFIRAINKYMETNQPWKLVKEDKNKAGTVLYYAAESLRLGLQLLHPIMPSRTKKMMEMIGVKATDYADQTWGKLKSGAKLGRFEAPFPRIEKKKEPISIDKKPTEEITMIDNKISFQDFSKVQLKTAKVLKAEKIEGADRLLKIQIKVGDEERQIVAGIAEHYSPEDLVGKLIVVVMNLEPATIRGVESNGMLLAAQKGKKLALVVVDDADIGNGANVS